MESLCKSSPPGLREESFGGRERRLPGFYGATSTCVPSQSKLFNESTMSNLEQVPEH
jgi:hypothetical protein